MKEFLITFSMVVAIFCGLMLMVAVAGLPVWIAIAAENYWWLLLLPISMPLPLTPLMIDWRRNTWRGNTL